MAPLLIAPLAVIVVCFANGAFPGMVGSSSIAFFIEGSIRCLSESFAAALTLSCDSLGLPYGYPILFGGPLVMLGALIMRVSELGSGDAYTISAAVMLTVALFGGYALLRRLGSGRIVAIATAVVYLVSPTILGLRNFGGTFFGFALLPAYAAADLLMIESLQSRSRRSMFVIIPLFAAVRLFALFMDGYSFMASGLVSIFLWVDWGLRSRGLSPWRRIAGLSLPLWVNALAVILYTLHASAHYGRPQLPVFRALGLDLVTLWLPRGATWFSQEIGWIDRTVYWGDGSNYSFNYIGFACVLLVVLYLVFKPRCSRAIAIGAAGLVALVLALGPALKINEESPGREGRERYYMPEGLAPELPWSDMFTTVPGLSSMRATYRWFGVTRMALIVMAGLGVSALAGKGRLTRVTAATLGLVAVIELAPDYLRQAAVYRDGRTQMEAFSHEVQADLVKATDRGDRAFFLSYDGYHNDWLVNYLAPAAGLKTYNAGGDKNHALASQQWPPGVSALARTPGDADALEEAFESADLDVVVAPFFHPGRDAAHWPPSDEGRAAAEAEFSDLLTDSRFDVVRRPWFAVIVPRS